MLAIGSGVVPLEAEAEGAESNSAVAGVAGAVTGADLVKKECMVTPPFLGFFSSTSAGEATGMPAASQHVLW